MPDPLKYPNIDKPTRKTYRTDPKKWDLNASGLYSFRVVKANLQGSVSVDNQVADFTEFVLPINPSSLSVSVPFAINTVATNGGVLEEHNGTIFRSISITGTFGVTAKNSSGAFLRGNIPENGVGKVLKDITGGAFPNTVGGVSAIAGSIQGVSNAIGNLPKLISGISASNLEDLGHSKINAFCNYLVAYSEYKKDPTNAAARLVFIDRKNGVSYVVTPVSFDTSKDSSDPHITRYRVNLKAWDLAQNSTWEVVGDNGSTVADRASVFNAALNTVRASMGVLTAFQDTIRGISQDFDGMIGLVLETKLLLEARKGIAPTTSDFQDIISEHAAELSAVLGLNINSTTLQSAINPGGLPNPNALVSQANTSQSARDNTNPFRTPQQRLSHYTKLDAVPLNTLVLTQADQTLVSTKLSKVKGLTIGDFDAIRSKIEDVRDVYTDAVGLGDDTYNAAVGRVPVAQLREATRTDHQILQAMNDLVQVVDSLTSTKNVAGSRLPDPYVRAQVNANNPSLVIIQYTNGFPVPFPHNGTLEGLASQYLETPDRWLEIAIANNLKPPYVDETGFTHAFSSNGVLGRKFTINDATNLYLNQEIFLSSGAIGVSARRIVSITKTTSGYIIEVDGDDDLDNLKVADSATLLAYMPNTINSNKTCIIPTKKPIDALSVPNTRDIPITINLDRQQRAMGVDLALTSEYDLALDSSGDIQLYAGVANALQAIKLKISLEKGTVPRHPEVGLGLQIGTANTHDAHAVRTALENAILNDGRFSAITGLSIVFSGPQISLQMTVKSANGSDVIPLSFVIS